MFLFVLLDFHFPPTTASCVLQQQTSQCQGMETTFYEDSRGYRGGTREDIIMRGTKRPMTLDLNSPKSKKPRGTALLTSPDLHMLKLESPELEKLIIQQHGMVGLQGQCMYPKGGDPYSRDFPDALGGLQQQQQQPSFNNLYQHHPPQSLQSDMGCGLMPPMSTMVDSYGYPQPPATSLNGTCNNPMVSSTMVSSTNCSYPPVSMGGGNGYYSMEPAISIKEEPQTVPCASPPDPPTSPIDMEDQEKMKLERKRLRNRIAASKCRRRKLERIARLEDKVAHLKSENADLQSHVTRLKEHVCHLKQQVLDHVRSGCDILVTHPSYNEEL